AHPPPRPEDIAWGFRKPCPPDGEGAAASAWSGSVGGVGIGVLASGSGTILRAILDAGIPVAVVVVDRPCEATEVATAAGVPAVLVERTSFGPGFDRTEYTHR